MVMETEIWYSSLSWNDKRAQYSSKNFNDEKSMSKLNLYEMTKLP